jgi:hypothetical protein
LPIVGGPAKILPLLRTTQARPYDPLLVKVGNTANIRNYKATTDETRATQ